MLKLTWFIFFDLLSLSPVSGDKALLELELLPIGVYFSSSKFPISCLKVDRSLFFRISMLDSGSDRFFWRRL